MTFRSAACALLLAALWPLSPAAAAPKGDDDKATAEAREHVNRAKVHFKLQEWDDAVKEWKEAYRLKPVALLLFNIAQASRMGGHYRQSKLYYDNFLRDMPDAPNREEVRKQLAQLDELIARVGDEEPPAKGAAKPEPRPKEATPPAKVASIEPPRPAEPARPPPPARSESPKAVEKPAVPAAAVAAPTAPVVASSPAEKSRLLTYALGAAAGAFAIGGLVEYGRARAGWSDAVATERTRPELDRRFAEADATWHLSLGLGAVALAAGAGAAVTLAF